MTADNAAFFLEKGASHIIVTSYVFKDGKINYENLKKIVAVTGKEHLVLDLSCRKKGHRPLAEVYRCETYRKCII